MKIWGLVYKRCGQCERPQSVSQCFINGPRNYKRAGGGGEEGGGGVYLGIVKI